MFQKIIENISEGIILVDDNGKVLLANNSFLDMFGYQESEILDQPIEIFVPNSFRKKHVKNRDNYIAHPRQRPMGLGMDLFGLKKSGEEFPIEISLSHTKIGTQVNTIAFVVDITERKKSELAIKKEKELAKLYLDTAESIIVVLDKLGCIKLINKKGLKLLGYEESEMLGVSWFKKVILEKELPQVMQVFQQMLSGQKEAIEFYKNHVLAKDKSIKLIEWHNKVIRDDSGLIVGIISAGTDITEIRRLEMENINALHDGQEEERKRLAEELHDGLVQTLSAVNINLNIMEEAIKSLSIDEQHAFDNAKELLNEAIDDTRSMSHDLMPGMLEISGLVPSIQSLISKIPQPYVVNFEYSDNIDRFSGKLELTLYRIIQELLNNIVKHSGASNIIVNLLKKGKVIHLEISDNGKGFGEDINKLKSNGIGLRNIFSRVNAMNGTLQFSSNQGEGVQVLVELPLT